MNKKYLTKTIIYSVLALVVMPVMWYFSRAESLIYIIENLETVMRVAKYLHIAIFISVLIFLGLAIYNLIKLLGDEEDGKSERG